MVGSSSGAPGGMPAENRQTFDFDPTRGKGSHGEVRIGEFHTTVQHGEIPRGTLANMLKDLNIDRREF